MSIFYECKQNVMQVRILFLIQMLPDKDANAIFMMQMSHVGMKMQSLSMMMLVCIFIPWCKCLLVGMSWCKWPLIGMQWCKCSNSNTNYSKIPFIFKIKASSVPETNIFSNLDLLFSKSHLFFYYLLKAPEKNWWSLLGISGWDINSKIWWSGSKDLFSQFGWAKGWHVSKAPFFWKNEFFENQAS